MGAFCKTMKRCYFCGGILSLGLARQQLWSMTKAIDGTKAFGDTVSPKLQSNHEVLTP
jgi:hypothetical protein